VTIKVSEKLISSEKIALDTGRRNSIVQLQSLIDRVGDCDWMQNEDIKECIELKQNIDTTEREIAYNENKLQTLLDRQARHRSNLEADASSEKWREGLSECEDGIRACEEEIAYLRDSVKECEEALDKRINSLQKEWTVA